MEIAINFRKFQCSFQEIHFWVVETRTAATPATILQRVHSGPVETSQLAVDAVHRDSDADIYFFSFISTKNLAKKTHKVGYCFYVIL